MQITPVSIDKVDFLPPLSKDYFKGDTSLAAFISNRPDSEGIKDQLQKKSKHSVNRKLLVERLKKQYEGITLNKAVEDNILSLADSSTYTITTGQQIHIFLGPLYVYWKILTTISHCDYLNGKFPHNKFVPVFWMATEDHDFEEICYAELFNQRLEWEKPDNYKGAVGRLKPASILPLLKNLNEIFQNDSSWKKYQEIFQKAYSEFDTFSRATRFAINEIFGDQGLVIIDADDHELKREFAPFMKAELLEQKSKAAVEELSAELEKKYSKQVNPRDINLFYLTENDRSRIELENGRYITASGTELGDEKAVLNLLNEYPERFSPNVVLRPLYQEVILPNLAYVGGPGELAYWLQLKSMFESFNVPYPVYIQRKSIFIAGKKLEREMEKAGLEMEDMFLPTTELEEKFYEKQGVSLISLQDELENAKNFKGQVLDKIALVDKSLLKEPNDIFQQLIKVLKQADKSLLAVQKDRYHRHFEKIEKLKSTFIDRDFVQERHQFIVQYLSTMDVNEVRKLLNYEDPASALVYILGDKL